MITTTDYNNYFGANTAPSNFTRLEYLSLNAIKSVITSDIPKTTDTIYSDFVKALCEQINYFSLNTDLLEDISSVGQSFSLGKYSESGKQEKVSVSDSIKRISPNTYTILLNINLLYAGLC